MPFAEPLSVTGCPYEQNKTLGKKWKGNDFFIIVKANFQQINSDLLRVCITETAIPDSCTARYGFLSIITSYMCNNPLMVGWTTTPISSLLTWSKSTEIKNVDQDCRF